MLWHVNRALGSVKVKNAKLPGDPGTSKASLMSEPGKLDHGLDQNPDIGRREQPSPGAAWQHGGAHFRQWPGRG